MARHAAASCYKSSEFNSDFHRAIHITTEINEDEDVNDLLHGAVH